MATYLITGATRGIGLEFASQLSRRGDSVIGTAREKSNTGPLAGLGVEVLPLDVSNPASCAALGARLSGRPVDVLINNAGVGSDESKSITTLEAGEMARVFAINSTGPMLVTRAVLPSLRAGERRAVVNISTQLASLANNNGGSSYGYRASKAALNMLTICLANELRGEGFTCVAVHPGWVQTDMGGPQAPLTARQSVEHLVRVIDGLKPRQSGAFLNYDGTPLPW